MVGVNQWSVLWLTKSRVKNQSGDGSLIDEGNIGDGSVC